MRGGREVVRVRVCIVIVVVPVAVRVEDGVHVATRPAPLLAASPALLQVAASQRNRALTHARIHFHLHPTSARLLISKPERPLPQIMPEQPLAPPHEPAPPAHPHIQVLLPRKRARLERAALPLATAPAPEREEHEEDEPERHEEDLPPRESHRVRGSGRGGRGLREAGDGGERRGARGSWSGRVGDEDEVRETSTQTRDDGCIRRAACLHTRPRPQHAPGIRAAQAALAPRRTTRRTARVAAHARALGLVEERVLGGTRGEAAPVGFDGARGRAGAALVEPGARAGRAVGVACGAGCGGGEGAGGARRETRPVGREEVIRACEAEPGRTSTGAAGGVACCYREQLIRCLFVRS